MKTKSFTPTSEMLEACRCLLVNMAFEETIREIVEGYQRRILDSMGYEKYELNRTYLLPLAVFNEYDRRCKEMRDFHKLKVENPDFCPLLVAEHNTLKAKLALIDVMQPVTGVTAEQVTRKLDVFDKFIDLTLRLLTQFAFPRGKTA